MLLLLLYGYYHELCPVFSDSSPGEYTDYESLTPVIVLLAVMVCFVVLVVTVIFVFLR